MAPHGFNLWASSGALCMDPKTGKACNAVDMLGTCYDKGGPKWIVHELGLYVGKMEYRRTHHPPAGWHLLRAELMAYNYLHVLLDAVFTMQADVAGGKKVAELHDGECHNFLLQKHIPCV